MNNVDLIIAIVMVAIIFLIHKIQSRPGDITIAPPDFPRTDLYYGYFGCYGNQASEVKSHTNLFWENQYQGIDVAIQNISIANKPTVLDVSAQVMTRFADHGKNYRFNPDALQNLRGLFSLLRDRGVIDHVVAIVPIDEPNTNVETEHDLQQAIDAIRQASAEYHEIAHVKLAIIYAAKPAPFPLLDQFDWVGVDDYDSKSEIFVNGTYDELKKSTRPGQKTILLPGGGFGQDPTPFVNFAHRNSEVVAVVPFVWFNGLQAADKWVGIGDDKNPLKQAYIAVGKTLTGQ